jgi:hypothetical protein
MIMDANAMGLGSSMGYGLGPTLRYLISFSSLLNVLKASIGLRLTWVEVESLTVL